MLAASGGDQEQKASPPHLPEDENGQENTEGQRYQRGKKQNLKPIFLAPHFLTQVERDLALIKSPAAGLRQAMKAKQQEEQEEGDMEMAEVDTSLNLASNKKKVKARQEAKVEEVHEDKLEEMMEEAD